MNYNEPNLETTIDPLPEDTKKLSKKRRSTNKGSVQKKQQVTSSRKSTSPSSQTTTETTQTITQTTQTLEVENIIFKPNPGPQTAFLAATEREVLFGGSAGGGKSMSLLVDPLRYITHPQFSGLLLRHTTEELRELVWKSQELYPKIIPNIKWSERKYQWEVPGGGRLWMSYLDRDEDVLRYQGQSFCSIYFDELTQWPTPFAWNYMRSRLRTTSPDLPIYMRATTNPGNKGHCVPFGEVLTRKGWIDIKDIKVGTDVLTMDQSMRMFFTPVSDVVKEHYVGPMIKRKHLMAFTENHRLPVPTDKGFDIKPYTDLPESFDVVRAGKRLRHDQDHNVPFVIPEYKGPTVRKKPQPLKLKAEHYCEFLAWWLAEGETDDVDSYVILRKKKGRRAEEIDTMLQRCGFNYEVTDNAFRIFSPDWWRYLRQFKEAKDRYVPVKVKHGEHADVFLDAIMNADGYWFQKGRKGIFYTSSKRLQDDFAEMAVLCGYMVRCDVRHRPPRKQPSYSVAISKCSNRADLSKKLLQREHFEGEVYCLTVPETEVFFIRQNGFVWLSGNTWVKKMFIDPAPPGKAFWATDIDTGETMVYPKGHAKEGEPLFKRRFIPAKLSDNPYLAESGDYEAMLLSLPEHQRRQLLDGDWDVAEGAAFSEFNRAKHVVEPFKIPSEWPRFRGCDYGYSSWSAVLWCAIAPDDTIYVYRELYVTKVLAEDLARMVLEAEKGEKIRYGVLDSSCWAKRGDTGPSVAERMILKGCKWRPADRSAGSRVSGKNEIHRRLQVDDFTGIPRLQIFNTCTQLIADLPSIPLDKKNPEDIDTNYHSDHLYDALRYSLMSRPRSGSVFDFNQEQRNRYVNPVDKKFGY